MSKNKNSCDCELCLFKTFPLDNPLVNNSNKIVESIIYHFIFRLGNLVKSRNDLNLYVLKFIAMINKCYLPYTPLKETIELFHKKIINSGKGCHFSTNTSLTKLINKEATYLKLIISSMEEEVKVEEVKEEEVKEEEVKAEEVKPEEVKPEDVKEEEVKGEEVKGEEVKVEEVKEKEVKGEEVKPEEVKGEECVVVEQKDATVESTGSYCTIS